MKTLLLLVLISSAHISNAQFFEMIKPYSGGHYAFSRYNPDGLNRFVVQFNELWASSISSNFSQFTGKELGQTFTTSGMRFVWGKKEMQWTASTDYALGFGKDKNKVGFENGISQHMEIRATNNQINNSFGVALKENSVWLEALYCTNLGRIYLEYSTVHRNDSESYGTEYKLNGLYKGTIRTMELGTQISYRRKKAVLYTRVLFPIAVIGPSKEERIFVDEQSSQPAPANFPSNYSNYVNDPETFTNENQGLNSKDFKGFSFGFGFLFIIGKVKN